MQGLRRVLETGSIRRRLVAAVSILAILPVVVLLASVYQLERMRSDARLVNLAGSLRMRGFVVASQLNSYLAAPKPYKWEIVQEELQRMGRALEILERGSEVLGIAPVQGKDARLRVADARHAMDLYRQVAQDVYASHGSATFTPERLEEVSQDVLGSAYGCLALSNLATESLELQARRALQRLQWLQGIAVAVALGIVLITLWAIRRFVLGPIPPFFAAFADIEKGRLGARVEVPGQNEFTRLGHAFNTMSESLERAHQELLFKQTEVLEKNTALERADRLKSQFVANMSHELRTPLNAIIGYTKLIGRGVYGEVPEKFGQALQGIDETSQGLMRLINDILDVAKIEAGKMDLYLESFRIEDLLREVGDMLQPLALAKSLGVEVDDLATVPNVTSDRDKIRRILVNLGANAVKFTRRGKVTLRLVAEKGGVFGIEVADTGIGIAPENLETVFEDFRQLDGSAAREAEGTGLGLAISRRLARHLGGDITVQSALEQGSTFTLRLPVFVRVDAAAAAQSIPGA